MRTLTHNEISFVSGAGHSSGCYTPPPTTCEPTPPSCSTGKSTKSKGNNGYGNGGNDGVPGHSGFEDSDR